MTICELKELCKERKIRGYGGKNKDGLITLLGGEPVPLTKLPVLQVEMPVLPVETPATSPTPSEETANTYKRDHFEMSGPFTYIFERFGHLDPIEPSPSSGLWHMLEIIDTTRPHFLVLSDVKHIVKHNDGATYAKLYKHLKERGYFHRYRVVNSLEKDNFYAVCLKNGEKYNNTYDYEKVEESRISVLMNPMFNKKYIFENDKWTTVAIEKDTKEYSYIRKHVAIDYSEKMHPHLLNSNDFSLRQCFEFTPF